jgi:hypothetical protein
MKIEVLQRAGLSDAQIVRVLKEAQADRREANRKHQQNHRARKQNRADSADRPDGDLFTKGEAVLGKGSGGMVKKLIDQNGSARAARLLDVAHTTNSPRAYVARVLQPKPKTHRERISDAIAKLSEPDDLGAHDAQRGQGVIEGAFRRVSEL